MKVEERIASVRKTLFFLLCAAVPVWIINLFTFDWAGIIGNICFILVCGCLWFVSMRTKNNLVRVFTAGVLFAQGFIPFLLFAFFLPLPSFLADLVVTPGFTFFLWLERGFSADVVTYTSWYTAMRSFMIPCLDGLAYGVVAIIIYFIFRFFFRKRSSASNG